MADIRINALATTASSTASDDFLAVDGSSQGTRKLNAFSPSFGGNATVGGNLTVSGTGQSSVAGSFGVGTSSPSTLLEVRGAPSNPDTNVFGQVRLTNNSTAYNANPRAGIYFSLRYNSGGALTAGGTSVQSYKENTAEEFGTGLLVTTQPNGGAPAERFRITPSGNLLLGTTTDGGQKLQVSAGAIGAGITPTIRLTSTYNTGSSGTSIDWSTTLSSNPIARISVFNDGGGSSPMAFSTSTNVSSPSMSEAMRITSGGNLLLGTTTDSANGKLQLTTHTTSAGGIGFGTDTSLYRAGTGVLQLDGSNVARLTMKDVAAGLANYIASDGGNLFIGVTDTPSPANDAIVLDPSKNVTFAGSATLAGNLTMSGGSGTTLSLQHSPSYGQAISKTISIGGTNVGYVNNGATAYWDLNVANADVYGADFKVKRYVQGTGLADVLTLSSAGNTTLSGNLTVSGSESSLTNSSPAPENAASAPGSFKFTGAGWNTFTGSQAIAVRLNPIFLYWTAAGSNSPFGQTYPDLAFDFLNSDASGTYSEKVRITGSGNLLIGGTTNITGGGGLKVFGTTAASSTTTGALQVAGGVGIAGAAYVGGNLNVSGTQNVFGLPSSASALGTNSTMTFERTSNTSLTIKVRGSDGTTRSVSLTLA